MKKRELTYILLAACLLTTACTRSSRHADVTAADSIPVTPRADSALVETFAGTSLTGPDASEWHLSVMHARHSGDGTFRLTIKREGTAPDTYTGRRYTLRGTDEDINATVWQCLVDTAHYFDFLLRDDSTLVFLPRDTRHEESAGLILKRQPAKTEQESSN